VPSFAQSIPSAAREIKVYANDRSAALARRPHCKFLTISAKKTLQHGVEFPGSCHNEARAKIDRMLEEPTDPHGPSAIRRARGKSQEMTEGWPTLGLIKGLRAIQAKSQCLGGALPLVANYL